MRWRAASAGTVFGVALIAVLAATIGPVYLHAVDQRVLDAHLANASDYQRDVSITRISELSQRITAPAGGDQTPENVPQLDPDAPAQLTSDVSAPASDFALTSSKSGLPPLIRLQACIGALPSKAASQACLAIIRQSPG